MDGWLITEDPGKVFAEGRQIAVPVLTGSNRDESFGGNPRNKEQFIEQARKRFGDLADNYLKLYPASYRQSGRSFCNATMALLLAGTFFVFTIFSGNCPLHQSLHHSGADGHQVCLICSLAHGQVTTAEVASFAAVLIFCLISGALLQRTPPVSTSDYRLLPGRAPPPA